IEGIDISQGGWIHWSVLATGTRNYSGEPIPLHKEPSADSPVVGTIKKADVTVRPMDITPDGSWVKVKSAYGTGWLEVDWLCGNPFTTCA
ncbi:MAG: SH3 domain-containing protein, partial [Bacteroidales bacterium]|nr:SH3 domain-containing protein [Bacteroidales bacterium]